MLEENYSFLRKLEHRLQIMFDLQTHVLPDDRRRAGQAGRAHGLREHADDASALRGISKTTIASGPKLNRKILDHLLHDAFGATRAIRAGGRSGQRSRPAARNDPRSAGPISVSKTCRRPTRT